MRAGFSIVVVVLLSFSQGHSQVQEVKFSQFFNFPLYLNPAATGNFAQDYRVAGIYRQQWNSINAEFTTFGISGDMKFSRGLMPGDFWGVGIYAVDDHLGDNLMQHQKVGLSLAYHHPLDFHGRHLISIGGVFSYAFSAVNIEKLLFESQFDGFMPDIQAPNGESFSSDNAANYDAGGGVSYKFFINRKWQTSVSVSALNLIAPQENFLLDSASARALNRGVVSGWVRYKLNDRVSLVPRWLINNQRNNTEVSSGVVTEYLVSPQKQVQLNIGVLGQWKEYVTFYAGAGIKNLEIHASYDLSIAGLTNIASVQEGASGKPGVFEISLVYRGNKRKSTASYIVPCRIF
ncbi:hypothetical protein C900_00807 [Fulvivirga imtechensis AK7]|uniref:Bacteroidetes-specific membrane protein n=1 Tax=Fulvivirga imtechensis AK7 TaxID=1237149 RepID=L8JV16_9BACT|nr:PorP/SprF family type IX secretion system membrane protein [Fulvivirga imtechensis]ELR72846.1 hypothetical protein C900_00807 [Fulvivirga imtechensis AK7]